jgi:hypothetical protein
VHNRPPMRPGKSIAWIVRGFGVLVITLVAAGCGSEKDERPAKWGYIYPAIIEPSCATASCHSRFAERSGVDLSDIVEARYQFVNRHFVTPFDPTTSQVMYLLRAQGSRRMPPDFPLPEVDIELIAKWITLGAKDD